MAIRYSTPYANLAGDTAAEYYVDLPGMFGTSTAPKILKIVNEAIRSRGMEELSQNRRAIQQYVAEEQPIIALIWGDAILPGPDGQMEGLDAYVRLWACELLVVVQPESSRQIDHFLIFWRESKL